MYLALLQAGRYFIPFCMHEVGVPHMYMYGGEGGGMDVLRPADRMRLLVQAHRQGWSPALLGWSPALLKPALAMQLATWLDEAQPCTPPRPAGRPLRPLPGARGLRL